MSSEPSGFRRHDPSAWTRSLSYRSRTELPYGGDFPAGALIMLDTTVYIDAQTEGRLPTAIAQRLVAAPLIHSAVAISEMVANLGLLDPSHPGTPRVRAALNAVLDRIAPGRIAAPSSSAWLEAAHVSGILARTQGFPAPDRRKLLNDALMFVSAGEIGAVFISRNRRDFDLLSRFRQDIRLWLYDRS